MYLPTRAKMSPGTARDTLNWSKGERGRGVGGGREGERVRGQQGGSDRGRERLVKYSTYMNL